MSQKICILCPGQGAQVVGMGKDFFEVSEVARAIFEKANSILGFDLSSACFGGPEERLNQTDVSQPAIYVTSVAAYEGARSRGITDDADVAVLAGVGFGGGNAAASGGGGLFLGGGAILGGAGEKNLWEVAAGGVRHLGALWGGGKNRC